MKRVSNLYEKINDIDIIIDMYDNVVSKNTKNKEKINKFNDYYSINIVNIKNIINSGNYIPFKYNIFLVREPKVRIIMSQNITDKLINHLVAKYFLIDVFDKSLIDSNIVTRLNKGTHYGIKLTKKYLNEMKRKYDNFYYLKFDISKYFYNIDHEVVKNIIKMKIKDKKVINIINNIIDSTNSEYVNYEINKLKICEIDRINKLNISEYEKKIKIKEINNIPYYKNGKGLPIGNMTSQILAVTYLNELDHFIKEKLKIKYYIRYMDDGILIHNNKEYLKYCLKEIEKILDLYKLKLNNKKTMVNSIKNGIDFLGFRFYVKDKKIILKVRNDCKKRFKKKMKKFNHDIYQSYIGHLKWGDCNSLIHSVDREISEERFFYLWCKFYMN